VARPYGFVQAKLTVGPANDRFEQEADAVADRVMGMEDAPTGTVGGGCAGCQADTTVDGQHLIRRALLEPEEMVDSAFPPPGSGLPEELALQRSATVPSAAGVAVTPHYATALQHAIAGGGQALASATRLAMEGRFDRDFSSVRIHSDGRAAGLARQIDARAFTLGRDIFFGAGEYAPTAHAGRRLLAHELAHVVQQSDGGESLQLRRTPCSRYPGYDASIDRFTYNCSGLALRTYVFTGTVPATNASMAQEFTNLSSPHGNCAPGKVKFWLWQYDMRFEDDQGTLIQSAQPDFHIVGARVNSAGNEPTNVYSKNGRRPIHGPGTGASFRPAAREPALNNNDVPTQTPAGRPIYKVRTNMSEQINCGNCL